MTGASAASQSARAHGGGAHAPAWLHVARSKARERGAGQRRALVRSLRALAATSGLPPGLAATRAETNTIGHSKSGKQGRAHTFDGRERAVQALAAACAPGLPLLGHPVEADGAMDRCAHCARDMVESHVRDRAQPHA